MSKVFKVYYFNDRAIPAKVFTVGLSTLLGVLEPATGDVFEVNIPEGYVPYIKTWETGVVMIDSLSEVSCEALSQASKV